MLIQGKAVDRPAAGRADYVRTVRQIVDAVNSIDPDAPYHDWFAGHPDARAAVHVKDGAYRPMLSASAALLGGTVAAGRAEDLRVNATDGKTGGIFLEGPGRFEVDRAVVTLSGDSVGIGGPATGAAVKGGGELILRHAFIDTAGLTHYATVAERNSVLRICDSVIASHGAPFGEGQPQPAGVMQTPPPGLMIDGNGRTHCTMTGSHSFFRRCLITSDGWGALSTETAEGFAYLEADDCRIVTVRRGYGAYADPGCHVVLDRCQVDSADMAGIVGGQGELVLRDCRASCGSCGLLLHSVAGEPEEIGSVEVTGGRLESAGPVALVRSDNAKLRFDHVELRSRQGVLIHTQINDDPLSTPPGRTPYGIEAVFRDLDAQGDILHEDTQRAMYLYLESATLRGAVHGACIQLDQGGKWFAAGDSEATLMGQAHLLQFDAPQGATIRLQAAQAGRAELPSGGVLELICDK